MNNKLDPKELKILADILALVLEDQPGQSSNALEAVKKRAKNNMITGGALKNLFTAIANDPPQRKPKKESTQTKQSKANSQDLITARNRISELMQIINRMDEQIRSLRNQHETLRYELIATKKSRADLQAELRISEAKSPFKTAIILVSLLCGLFFGIAGISFINSMSAPTQPDSTIYLR